MQSSSNGRMITIREPNLTCCKPFLKTLYNIIPLMNIHADITSGFSYKKKQKTPFQSIQNTPVTCFSVTAVLAHNFPSVRP